jgi:hypothetical protein
MGSDSPDFGRKMLRRQSISGLRHLAGIVARCVRSVQRTVLLERKTDGVAVAIIKAKYQNRPKTIGREAILNLLKKH